MARTAIGLDIGTRAVGLAEVQVGSGTPTVTRFGRILLPIGAVDHGDIHDPDAVAAAVTMLWKRLGLSGKSVHVGVANRRVVVRVIELPEMPREDLAGAIRFQAQEHIPIPLDEAVLDFEVIDERQTPEGEKFQRVLIVAAERGTVQSLIAAVQAAKLEPKSLELNAYPLVRCFGTGSAGAEAIIDIGAGVTNVVVHRDGKIRFARILPTFGGDEFTNAVAQALGMPQDEAETLKRKASALLREGVSRPFAVRAAAEESPPDDPTAPETEPDESEDVEAQAAVAGGGPVGITNRPRPVAPGFDQSTPAVRPRPFAPGSGPTASASVGGASELDRAAQVIDPLLNRFVTEVRGSVDFYSSQEGAAPIDRAVVTGGGSLMGGVVERLGSALGVPVELGHPFEQVPIGKVNVSPEERKVAEPFIGLAIGLALAGAKA